MLTIGVGCTGGKHRSVCLAEKFIQNLKKNILMLIFLIGMKDYGR